MRSWILVGAVLLALFAGVASWTGEVGADAPSSKRPGPSRASGSPNGAPPALVAPDDTPAGEAAEPETPVERAPVEERQAPAEEAPEREPPPVPGPVVLFEHADHDRQFAGGRRWVLAEGLTEAGAAFEDDAVSRVAVPEGRQVALFEDHGGRGRRLVLGPGDHNLAPYDFNDRTSSARVSRYGSTRDLPPGSHALVQLYRDNPDGESGPGRVWTLALPRERSTALFTAAGGDFADDAVTAAWVPAGQELTLFDEPDGRGVALVLGPGLHDLTTRWNDRTSSARVRREE